MGLSRTAEGVVARDDRLDCVHLSYGMRDAVDMRDWEPGRASATLVAMNFCDLCAPQGTAAGARMA